MMNRRIAAGVAGILLVPLVALEPVHAIPDSSFGTNLGSGFNSGVEALAVQADGKLLVGGYFTSLNNRAVPQFFLRLNPDGTPDTAFNSNLPTIGGSVYAVAVQGDGKILVGGFFTQPGGQSALVRLNSNGTPDGTFNGNLGSGFGGKVGAISVQPDGKIVVGGHFLTLSGQDVPDMLVRLNADGTPDSSFNASLGAGFDGGNGNGIRSVGVRQDGEIIVAGSFTTLNGFDVSDGVLFLHGDGSQDLDANARLGLGIDGEAFSLGIQSDGAVVLGGRFSSFGGTDVPDSLVRLRPDGSLDRVFDSALGSGFDFGVFDVTVQSDGRILVGGDFTDLNGADVQDKIIRLEGDGTVDGAFNQTLGTGPNNYVLAVMPRSSGSVLVGGTFTQLSGSDVPDGLMRVLLPPSPIRDLAAIPGSGQVQLSWLGPSADGGAAVTGYTIDVAPSGSCTPLGSVTSATCTGLDNGVEYTFTLQAINAAGRSPALSAVATPRATPSQVRDLAAIPGNGQVQLSWLGPSADGGAAVTGYTIDVAPSGSCIVLGPVTSATCTGLKNGVEYIFTVRAVNAVGKSMGLAIATTPQTAPAVPRYVLAAVGDARAVVRWAAPANSGGATITSYSARAIASGHATRTCSGSGTARTCVIWGLVNGVTYSITVAATNAAGTSPLSAPVLARPRTVPTAPLKVAVSVSGLHLAVKWTSPSSSGGLPVTSYRASAAAHGHTTRTCATAGAARSCTITGLVRGVTYSVKVVARNPVGASPSSLVRFVKLPA